MKVLWKLVDAIKELARAVGGNTIANLELTCEVEKLSVSVERVAVALEKLTEVPPEPVRAEITIGTRVNE